MKEGAILVAVAANDIESSSTQVNRRKNRWHEAGPTYLMYKSNVSDVLSHVPQHSFPQGLSVNVTAHNELTDTVAKF